MQPLQKELKLYRYAVSYQKRSITASKVIISRSGYSTVMDIIGLGKKCIFIPTPGQPEQNYLAHYLEGKNLCIYFAQHNFSLASAMKAANEKSFASLDCPTENAYEKVMEDFIIESCKRKYTD